MGIVAISSLDLIGNTPIVRIKNVIPDDVKAEIWAKAEFMSLSGSIKDRIALYMIRKAEREGRLKAGATLVVATTGNTGIAFAAVGTYLGYRVLIVIPEEMSAERYKLMKLYGADFILTPGGESDVKKSLDYAYELAEKQPEKYVVIDQWNDEGNVKAHYETTGKEILEQLGEVDVWVAGIGTGGTLIGVAKRLKEAKPDTLVVGVEPAECPTIFRGVWGRHEIEGIGDGFVPNIVERYKHLIDDYVLVGSEQSIEMARKLALKEGLGVGISSGANIVAAISVARKYDPPRDAKIITVLPDYAARYFSTRLFE